MVMLFESEYNQLKSEISELEASFNDPAVSSDPNKIKDLSKRYGEIKEVVSDIENLRNLGSEIEENKKLLEQEEDLELQKLLEEDIETSIENYSKLERKIKFFFAPADPNDSRNVILEIRAGTGGDEASLFASDLFRMYSRFSENSGWKVEIIDQHRSEVGGTKEVIAQIFGKNVYKYLKNESGVHRVQRIPSTEKNGRIHTSTATVAILPEAEEAEIDINPKDLRIDVFRSSGPGGQNVNMTDSAVRITHIPTGVVVTCQDQKSQHKNKDKAMKVLSSRLLAFEIEKNRKERDEMRLSQVGSGERSEKIRTYNFPQNRITDHRLKKSWHNIEGIMEGQIEDIVSSFSE